MDEDKFNQLKQFVKSEMQNTINESVDSTLIFMYVSSLENKIKEYEDKIANYVPLIDCVPKVKIKEYLKVCENVYDELVKPYIVDGRLVVTGLSKGEQLELINKRNCLITQISTYKQLLDEPIDFVE